MTDILKLVFRTFVSRTESVKNSERVSPSSTACSALVVGERSLSRSLLLLAAVTAASELGMNVIFFTQTQIQSLPVSLQTCIPSLSPESLKKIKFSYPKTMVELRHQVASLHESPNTSPTPPSLIIVDRLEGYLRGPGEGCSCSRFHQGEQSCIAHVSALLHDTAAFLTQDLVRKASGLAPCRVIAAFQPDFGVAQTVREPSAQDPILAVLDRYFQVRCTLDRDESYRAAATGLQEVWHVYLSGTGITEATCTKDCKDKLPSVAQEWQLNILQNGLLEFTLV
ncbi:ATPase SWSAP1 [Lampris incognitus]|uniref:ATPase SWSAP1 n=1 Tax=Lampris incognitus TaxID=2546036 RepID=UPI0024B4F20D|nr:ATPase SWSAP1 [Lampris incognitus]